MPRLIAELPDYSITYEKVEEEDTDTTDTSDDTTENSSTSETSPVPTDTTGDTTDPIPGFGFVLVSAAITSTIAIRRRKISESKHNLT